MLTINQVSGINPNQRGRTLSNSPKDAALRTQWDTIAAQLLDQLQPLSLEQRRRLGSYTVADRALEGQQAAFQQSRSV